MSAAHEFLTMLRGAGFVLEHVEGDGQLHRCDMESDRRGAKSGWYVLHLDGHPAGAFGDWKTGEAHTWRQVGNEMSATEQAQHAAAVAQARQRREAERMRAWQDTAERARSLWQASRPASPQHPYLQAKGIDPHGIRQRGRFLLVPMRDAAGELWNLQHIGPDGGKRFLFRGRLRGLYCPLGGSVQDVLCIAEGFATAATVLEASGYPVAVTFTTVNLLPVGETLRAKYPNARLVFCADDDAETEARIGRNPGREAAKAAAAAVGGTVALPPLAEADAAARGELRPQERTQ